jgi:hypothetical protein
MKRDTNNAGDDEFGMQISEEEFNKKHMKALKDAEPTGIKKRKKRRIPKEKPNIFRGLGGGSSSRGPWKA